MSLVILFHFLRAQHVWALIYPSSGACDGAVELPHRSFYSRFVVCWRFGVAGFEWCPCCRLQPATRTPLKLLMMDILMSETFWVHKKWNKIASDIKLVFCSSTMTYMSRPITWSSAGRQNTNMNALKVKLLKCYNQSTHFNTLVCILLVHYCI